MTASANYRTADITWTLDREAADYVRDLLHREAYPPGDKRRGDHGARDLYAELGAALEQLDELERLMGDDEL